MGVVLLNEYKRNIIEGETSFDRKSRICNRPNCNHMRMTDPICKHMIMTETLNHICSHMRMTDFLKMSKLHAYENDRLYLQGYENDRLYLQGYDNDLFLINVNMQGYENDRFLKNVKYVSI